MNRRARRLEKNRFLGMNYSHEFLGEYTYFIIPSEDYDAVPEGTNLKFEGVIEKKPIIKHLRSKKPPRIQGLRYFIQTQLIVNGVDIKYEGPAFLRKGEKVTVWGKKGTNRFDAVKIETEDVIIMIY